MTHTLALPPSPLDVFCCVYVFNSAFFFFFPFSLAENFELIVRYQISLVVYIPMTSVDSAGSITIRSRSVLCRDDFKEGILVGAISLGCAVE